MQEPGTQENKQEVVTKVVPLCENGGLVYLVYPIHLHVFMAECFVGVADCGVIFWE